MSQAAPRIWVTLRRGVRAWWDHLGLACLGSAVWLLATMAPWAIADRLGLLAAQSSALWLTVTALASTAGHALVSSGLAGVAHAAVAREETAVGGLLDGIRKFPLPAVALGLTQASVLVAALLNLAFYASLRSPLGSVMTVLLGYVLVFWLMNCQYHWPLLVASQSRLITRDDGGTPGLRSVLRNALVLTLASPVYSLSLFGILVVLGVGLTMTGVGLALVAPALTAFLAAQALRDHLVHRGMVAPPQDEGATPDDAWRLPT